MSEADSEPNKNTQSPAIEVSKVPTLDIGPRLEGLVEAVSEKSVSLLLDDGRQAIIHRQSFGLHNESPVDIVSVGDRCIGVELDREDPSGKVVLSRAWALKQDAWQKITQAFESKEILKGKVIGVRKQGLLVDIGLEAFMPASHLDIEKVDDLNTFVGEVIEFQVLEADQAKDKLVVSRRSLAKKQQRKRISQALDGLRPGQVLTGSVDSVSDYGAFVKIGEVVGLVHISELAWKDIKKPSEVVSVGDEIEVKVLEVRKGKQRVSLSAKACMPDPMSDLDIGKVYGGKVDRLADFGAFVSIGSLTGLVHLSELSEYRVSHPSEVVMPGEEVRVKVLDVNSRDRRISLSLRQASEYSP